MPSPLEQLQILMQLARLRQGGAAEDRAQEDQALQREAENLRAQAMQRELAGRQAYGQMAAPVEGPSPTAKILQRVALAKEAGQYAAPPNYQGGTPGQAVGQEVLQQYGGNGTDPERYALKKQMVQAGVMKISDFTPSEQLLFNAEQSQMLQSQMQQTEDPAAEAARKAQEWNDVQSSYYREEATKLGAQPIPEGKDVLDVMQESVHPKDWMGVASAMGRQKQMESRLAFIEKADQLGGTKALSATEKANFGFVAEQREKLRESFSVNPEQAPWLYSIGGKADKEKRTQEFKAYLEQKYKDAPGDGWFGLGKNKEYQIELQNWEANVFRPTQATKTKQEGQALAGKPVTEWYILNKSAEQNQLQELSKFDKLYQYYLQLNMIKAGIIQSSIPSGESGPPLSPDMMGQGPGGGIGPQPPENELDQLEQEMIQSARDGNTSHQRILDQMGVPWQIQGNPQQ